MLQSKFTFSSRSYTNPSLISLFFQKKKKRLTVRNLSHYINKHTNVYKLYEKHCSIWRIYNKIQGTIISDTTQHICICSGGIWRPINSQFSAAPAVLPFTSIAATQRNVESLCTPFPVVWRFNHLRFFPPTKATHSIQGISKPLGRPATMQRTKDRRSATELRMGPALRPQPKSVNYWEGAVSLSQSLPGIWGLRTLYTSRVIVSCGHRMKLISLSMWSKQYQSKK